MKVKFFLIVLFLISAGTNAQLSGTFTIGGATPDYATISSAVTALSTSGVSGAVVFDIRDGIYQEKVIIPAITGASATNTITFQSELGDSSQVILSDSSHTASTNNFTLQLNGCDYVTFKNITIRRTGTATYGTVVAFANEAKYCRFLNNHIHGTVASSLTTNSTLIYSASSATSGDSASIFSNNLMENGSYGLYLYGQSTTTLESGTMITNNIFKNTYGRSIQLGNQNSPVISGNEITTTSSIATFYCMYFTSCENNMIIEKNKMSSPSGYGMYLTASNGANGMNIMIINNFIHVGGSGTSQGIYLTGSSFITIYHNSIHVTGTGATSNCFYATSATTTKLISQNNVLVNSGGGLTYYIATSSSTALSVSNYNDLYSTGSNLAFFDTATVQNLAAWKSATGRDANSVSADPVFASVTDLHAFGGGIADVGTPLAAVTTDIDGEARSTISPDLGADEFIPLVDNIVVSSFVSPATIASCGDTATSIEISVGNIGSASQTNIPIQVVITGPASMTFYDTIAGPLLPNTVTQRLFTQTINTTGGGSYTFQAFTSLANDQYRNNDTLSVTRNFFQIPNSPLAVSPQQVCDNNASITASADTGHSVFWYDQPTGGNLLFIGSPFNTALVSDSTFYIEAREGGGSSGCLRITECEIGTNDFIEVENLSGAGFDATGWVVAISNSYTDINSINVNLWQLGFFNPGEIQTRSDVTGANYWGNNMLWNPGSNSWAILIDSLGNVRDFVAWGWTDVGIQAMNTTINGFNITIGAEWTGNGFTACATGTISRTGNSDSNSSADFACETNTIGLQNANLSPAFSNCGLGLCSSLRIPVDVTIVSGANVNLGNDTVITLPFSYTLDAGAGFTSYLWSDNSTGQTLTVTQSGVYWVTVTGSNGCTFTDYIGINVTTSINENLISDMIHAYPNPVNETLQIEMQGTVRVHYIVLSDMKGRIVYDRTFIVPVENKTSIDMHSLNSGVYYLAVHSYEGVKVIKVIVNH